MEDPSKPQSIRLTDYLIEQGAGSDSSLRAAIYAEIYGGALPAVITVHPELPPGASTRDIHRYANSKVREISVLESPRVKVELRKAALGRDPDWSLLDAVNVKVPAVPDEPEPDEPDRIVTEPAAQKISPTQQLRAEIMLDAIKKLDLVPDALEPPEANGGGGDRARIRAEISFKTMTGNAFKNAWGYMLYHKIVSYKKI